MANNFCLILTMFFSVVRDLLVYPHESPLNIMDFTIVCKIAIRMDFYSGMAQKTTV